MIARPLKAAVRARLLWGIAPLGALFGPLVATSCQEGSYNASGGTADTAPSGARNGVAETSLLSRDSVQPLRSLEAAEEKRPERESQLPDTALGLPSLEPLGEFGCVACNGPELFDNIRSVAAGSGRSFAVLTYRPPYVRRWDLASNDATQFGTEGQGPAELTQPIGLAFFHDSIRVFDNRGANSRIVTYTLGGEYGGYRGVSDPLTIATSQQYAASPSGQWTLWTASPQGRQSIRLVRTASTPESGEIIPIPAQLLTGIADPSAGATLTAAVSDEGRVAIGFGNDYKLAVVSADSVPILYGGRTIARRERSEEEIDALLAETAQALSRVNTRRPPPTFDREKLREIPHFGLGDLRFDGKNRLWVRTSHGRERTSFDIFGRNLDYLGTVEVDGQLLNYHVGPLLLVGVATGSQGVPIVKVWSIVK
jgi:hypothetical protein